MNKNEVTMRCDCGFESVIFSLYSYNSSEPSYELSFEDSYAGGHKYRGFFGRLKRAWHAFRAKPVVYTSLYTEDKEKMRKFFSDCLDKLN